MSPLSRAQATMVSGSLYTLVDQMTTLAGELDDDAAENVPARLKGMTEEVDALADLAQRYDGPEDGGA